MPSISDDFNRANATSLGANWTDVSGDWQIVGNEAKAPTGGTTLAYATHTTDLLTVNMQVEVDIVASPDAIAFPRVVAGADGNNDWYAFGYRKGGTGWRLDASEGGTTTTLTTSAATAPTLPYRLKIEITNDNVVTCYCNGVQVLTYTNTSTVLPAGTFAGIMSSHNNDVVDNFAALSSVGWTVGSIAF